MAKSGTHFIKANRIVNPIRNFSWIFSFLVAIGGLWEPKLGLLVILIMAGLTATSFFKGRYWCGNICPHGSFFDKIVYPISRNAKIPKVLKSKIFITLFFMLFMFGFMSRVLAAFSSWGTHTFLDKLGFVFVFTYLVVLIIGGLLASFTTPRTWCQFCPMGTIQKASHKVGKTTGITKTTEKKVTIEAKEKCLSCAKCAKVCPFQLTPYLEFGDNNQFNNHNCIKCSICVENCPPKILSMGTEKAS